MEKYHSVEKTKNKEIIVITIKNFIEKFRNFNIIKYVMRKIWLS